MRGLRGVSVSRQSPSEGVFIFHITKDILGEGNLVTIVEEARWNQFVAYFLNYFIVLATSPVWYL